MHDDAAVVVKLTDHLDPSIRHRHRHRGTRSAGAMFSAANETMGRVISQSQKVVIAVAIMIVIRQPIAAIHRRFVVPLYTIGIRACCSAWPLAAKW